MFYAGAKVVFNFTNITPSASFRTAGKLRSHLGHLVRSKLYPLERKTSSRKCKFQRCLRNATKVLPCDYLTYMFYVYIRYILYIYIHIYIYNHKNVKSGNRSYPTTLLTCSFNHLRFLLTQTGNYIHIHIQVTFNS